MFGTSKIFNPTLDVKTLNRMVKTPKMKAGTLTAIYIAKLCPL